ncbi:TIGR01906 family membrane protein [Brevibacterium sp. 5221]|uniref:TIGR01906 family membrane protein n=1 Tax=Brevibacterium rongguiense TaxID=2695267 RepID=A0A6N9H918_9MICO|nr:TIGR01906 family membrane protein [Brevibacterium rongguiense]MYM19992.1 TIGR01906 family membrane protein [Brevibacterium rongguiense]
MADDEKNTDDLMSRRMRSGSQAEEPQRAEPAADSAAASDRVDEESLDDTVAFEAFPAVKPQTSQRPAVPSAGAKPDMLSDEEWAAITGAPAAEPDATAVGAVPAGAAAAAGSTAAGATGAAGASSAKPRRRYTFVDVIATLWIALGTPFVLIALGVRVVASGLFLKFEYFYRPGFPADPYGFSADDRMHFASYTVDYLSNMDGSRYLTDIAQGEGSPLFTQPEIAHMADVKSIISLLYLVAVVAVIGAIIAGLALCRKHGPGMHAGLRWGAILTLLITVGAVVVALFGFETFFANFHRVLFPGGNWEFYLDDSLIRLFPQTFWMDAGIGGGAIVILAALALLGISAIGGRRRREAKRLREVQRARAERTRKAERDAAKEAEKSDRAAAKAAKG